MNSHLIGGSLQMSSQLIDGEENELSSDWWIFIDELSAD